MAIQMSYCKNQIASKSGDKIKWFAETNKELVSRFRAWCSKRTGSQQQEETFNESKIFCLLGISAAHGPRDKQTGLGFEHLSLNQVKEAYKLMFKIKCVGECDLSWQRLRSVYWLCSDGLIIRKETSHQNEMKTIASKQFVFNQAQCYIEGPFTRIVRTTSPILAQLPKFLDGNHRLSSLHPQIDFLLVCTPLNYLQNWCSNIFYLKTAITFGIESFPEAHYRSENYFWFETKTFLITSSLNYPTLYNWNEILLDGAKSYIICAHIKQMENKWGWARLFELYV